MRCFGSSAMSMYAFAASSLFVLILLQAPDSSSGQFILVPFGSLPPFPFEIDEFEYFLVALPVAGFVTGLYLTQVLPVKVSPGRLLPFLDATSVTDRLQNVTTNASNATAPGCNGAAMTVFDAVRCRFNQSAEFDYRTLLRTLSENPASFTKDEQKQLWLYNAARGLADFAFKVESDDQQPAVLSNEIPSRKKRGRSMLSPLMGVGRAVDDVSWAPSSSAPSSGSADGEFASSEEKGDDDRAMQMTIEALVTSDWKSCLAEMVCEVDKASRKYGFPYNNDVEEFSGYATDAHDNDVGKNGWIFGKQDCSKEYKKCAFNFKGVARSLFRKSWW